MVETSENGRENSQLESRIVNFSWRHYVIRSVWR